MGFFKEYRLGIRSYSTAWKFITEHKLWGFAIIPGFINLALIGLIIIIAVAVGKDLNDSLNAYFEIDIPILGGLVEVITAILIFFTICILFYYTYRYMMLIFLSPALAIFAEKIMEVQTGETRPFVFKQFAQDVLRGIILAIRNLLLEMVMQIVIFIIGFIPLIQIAAPFLSFFVSAFYQGFSMIDYRNELNRMSVKDSSDFVRNHRGLAMGNGTIFGLSLFIPVLGAMFGPTLSLAAAQLAVTEIEEMEKQKIQDSKTGGAPIPLK